MVVKHQKMGASDQQHITAIPKEPTKTACRRRIIVMISYKGSFNKVSAKVYRVFYYIKI
jgi:hypothetical protein